MELIYLAAALVVVFLCLFCIRQGYKIGRAEKQDRPLEKIVEIPQKEKKDTDENSMDNQFAAWSGYQPKYTEVKHEEK